MTMLTDKQIRIQVEQFIAFHKKHNPEEDINTTFFLWCEQTKDFGTSDKMNIVDELLKTINDIKSLILFPWRIVF